MTENNSSTSAQLLNRKAEVPGEFDRIARHYDLATGLSQGYGADLHRSAAFLQLQGGETVADLCCGTGKSTEAVQYHLNSGRIIAIDNSAGMLQQARKNLSGNPGTITVDFRKEDVMNLSLDDNSCDAVFMAYGIRNMPDYQACISNLYRVLKPGGRIVFHEYALASPAARIYWRVLGYGFIVPFTTLLTGTSTIFRYLIKSVLNFLTPDELQALLARNGFTKISARPLPGWRKPILYSFIAEKPLNEPE
jgi:ubiquinone/menaquinone biosynthesis methyltransferase